MAYPDHELRQLDHRMIVPRDREVLVWLLHLEMENRFLFVTITNRIVALSLRTFLGQLILFLERRELPGSISVVFKV